VKLDEAESFFRGNSLGHLIDGFPYAERYCPYCQRECTVVDAIHIQEEPEHYKALFICFNGNCGAYDEEARTAYARVYYSSDFAFRHLEEHRIYFNRGKKQ
jgi:hypothetical protein